MCGPPPHCIHSERRDQLSRLIKKLTVIRGSETKEEWHAGRGSERQRDIDSGKEKFKENNIVRKR